MWRLVEMELSLLYDILYTKAAVIHTRRGYAIRVFSVVDRCRFVVRALLVQCQRWPQPGRRRHHVRVAGRRLLPGADVTARRHWIELDARVPLLHTVEFA